MRKRNLAGFVTALCVGMAGAAHATPTTNVWNPSTDVQAAGVLHLGIDNYLSPVRKDVTKAVGFGTDVGLTYGAGYGFEVGVDYFGPGRFLNADGTNLGAATDTAPLLFNAKWGHGESGSLPAFAVGVQSIGTNRNTNASIAYGLLSKSFPEVGRVTLGGYKGRKRLLGDKSDSGVIAAWDRAFGEKWWGSVDYASGKNYYGALAFGGSYKFTPKVGLIVGYVIFNAPAINPSNTVTTQLDIDF